MKRVGAVLLVVLALTACTRVVSGPPRPQLSVAPIAESQVRDLLSREAQAEPVDVYVYTGVDPAECAGLVQEANSPLIFDAKPAVNDGGFREDGDAQIIEIAAVYRTNYVAQDALATARRALGRCQDRPLVTTADDGEPPTRFRLKPPVDSGTPDIAVWSVVAAAGPWTCDNAFTAAYNAAVLITACSRPGGYDVTSLAHAALDRIHQLVNAVA